MGNMKSQLLPFQKSFSKFSYSQPVLTSLVSEWSVPCFRLAMSSELDRQLQAHLKDLFMTQTVVPEMQLYIKELMVNFSRYRTYPIHSTQYLPCLLCLFTSLHLLWFTTLLFFSPQHKWENFEIWTFQYDHWKTLSKIQVYSICNKVPYIGTVRENSKPKMFSSWTFFNHVNIFDVVVCLLKIAEFKLNVWQ